MQIYDSFERNPNKDTIKNALKQFDPEKASFIDKFFGSFKLCDFFSTLKNDDKASRTSIKLWTNDSIYKSVTGSLIIDA